MQTAHDEVELRLALLPETSTEEPGCSYSGKHTEWFQLSSFFAIRSGKVFLGILTVLAVSIASAAIIGSVFAANAYRKIALPHKAVHASEAQAKDGLDVVRPYFAPPDRGGVSEISLSISVWFRPGKPLPTPSSEAEDRSSWFEEEVEGWHRRTGELGYVVPESGAHPPWKLVWSGSLSGLTSIQSSCRTTIPLVLSAEIMTSLATERSSLVATFELRPSTGGIRGTAKEHTSTRPVAMYGSDKPWPLPEPINKAAASNPLDAFLAHSSAGTSLVERERFYYSEDFDDDSPEAFSYATSLSRTTMVTFASDYSIYRRAEFVSAMDALRSFKEQCANATHWRIKDECVREFARDGHLENMLTLDTAASTTEWRYGPFLTTRLSPRTAASYEAIAGPGRNRSVTSEDYHFNWTVAYRAMSPAKLSLFKYHDWPELFNENSSESAQRHDHRELYMALFGLNLNPNSRPILRGALGMLVRALQMLNIPLVVLYWLTRRTFAGLPIATLTIETISDLVYCLGTRMIARIHPWDRGLSVASGLAAVAYFALAAKQLYLRYRPEFAIKAFGRSGLRVPTAVRFRRPNVAEQNTLNADRKFDWRLRLAICIVAILCFRFSSWPPPIIEGRQYVDMIYGSHGAQHWDEKVLRILHMFDVVQSSVWLVSRLSQIHLNHRNKTFAGSYRLSVYALFGAELLSGLVKVFGTWFGRAQYLRPFTMWNCLSLIVLCTLVGQAVKLPSIQQEAEEDRGE